MLRPAAHPDRPEVERKFHLTINPDPRSLWKNLPSDPALPFAKPDDAVASLDTEELRWLGASRRGRSHAHDAKPRDDDFAFTRLSNGWHVAITSDGAGGSKFSRRGSQVACEVTLAWLSARLGAELDSSVMAWFSAAIDDSGSPLKSEIYTLLGGAAFETHKVLASEAEKLGAAARDFHATYIVVIAKQFNDEWFVASFTIGDGGAGLLDENGNLKLLSTPDGGDFAGQTVFVTMPSVFKDPVALMRRVHFHRVASLKMIVLMTDGVTDPKFETDTNFETAAYWHSLSAEVLAAIDSAADSLAAADTLQTWLDFWSPGNHDDRTIVLGLPLLKTQCSDAT
jgi:serine/threonine protein phosphatase PrpC